MATADTLPSQPLTPSERQDCLNLSARGANEQGQVPLAAHTLHRLLTQLSLQEQELHLHQRREKGLRTVALAWRTLGTDMEDYQDAASEVLGVLDNPNYDHPAYDDYEPEHDGQGWCAPFAPCGR